MNEFTMQEAVEKLESVFLNILYLKPEDRLVTPNINHLTDINTALNTIFVDCNCTDVLYTVNTDKQFFGVKVNPIMNASDALTIVATDERIRFSKYQVELDSKLFEVDLSAEEIAAILIFEISSMIGNYEIIDRVRELIDVYMLTNDDVVHIRDSANYAQLIIYALKDSIYKLSSVLFKEDPEDILTNSFIQATDLQDAIISGQQKINSSSYGIGDGLRTPNTAVLKWMFIVYKDMSHNSTIVKDTLKEAREFAASKLDMMEIDKTIACVDRINMETFTEGTIINVLEANNMHSVCEISLFKSLKANGLRGIENDLYEAAVRIKNLETEEDAMYTLRFINNRIGILEDYIYNTPDIPESEKRHWLEVAQRYRDLRVAITKKKIWSKKSYGLYFDYNQKFDDEEDEY